MAGTANFSVEKGDTFIRNITFRNKATQVPVNLTGATITGFIEKNGVKVTDLRCGLNDAAIGYFYIMLFHYVYNQIFPEFPATLDSNDLAEGIYQIEVKVEYSDHTIQTLIKGNLVVTN